MNGYDYNNGKNHDKYANGAPPDLSKNRFQTCKEYKSGCENSHHEFLIQNCLSNSMQHSVYSCQEYRKSSMVKTKKYR